MGMSVSSFNVPIPNTIDTFSVAHYVFTLQEMNITRNGEGAGYYLVIIQDRLLNHSYTCTFLYASNARKHMKKYAVELLEKEILEANVKLNWLKYEFHPELNGE